MIARLEVVQLELLKLWELDGLLSAASLEEMRLELLKLWERDGLLMAASLVEMPVELFECEFGEAMVNSFNGMI